jgi:hypothetical protein
MIRYYIGAGLLTLSMVLSYILRFTPFEVAAILALIINAYLIERTIVTGVVDSVLFKKGLVTEDDINNLNQREYNDGSKN